MARKNTDSSKASSRRPNILKKEKKKSKIEKFSNLPLDPVVIDFNAYSSHFVTSYRPRRFNNTPAALNQAQGQYMTAIKSNKLTFGVGPAGTGKSFCTAMMASEALENKDVDRIIVSRPAVEADESLGFLPGTLTDKYDPFFDSFRDCLIKIMGKGAVDCCIKNERIQAIPLAYLRGKTFQDAFVVLDEAQNCTSRQLKMFLSRIGDPCKMVVNGDPEQTDIGKESGLEDAMQRLRGLKNVYIHLFERSDIIRSGLAREIIERYENN